MLERIIRKDISIYFHIIYLIVLGWPLSPTQHLQRENEMNKIKCPLCHRGVESIINKKNEQVFQKHIGVGVWDYGQSRGRMCWSSYKKIERTDIPESYKKFVDIWNEELKRIQLRKKSN